MSLSSPRSVWSPEAHVPPHNEGLKESEAWLLFCFSTEGGLICQHLNLNICCSTWLAGRQVKKTDGGPAVGQVKQTDGRLAGKEVRQADGGLAGRQVKQTDGWQAGRQVKQIAGRQVKQTVGDCRQAFNILHVLCTTNRPTKAHLLNHLYGFM